jgi:hypothetical protein
MAAAQPRLMTHIFALCNLVMWMDSLADLTLSLNGSRWSVAQGVVGRWGGGARFTGGQEFNALAAARKCRLSYLSGLYVLIPVGLIFFGDLTLWKL